VRSALILLVLPAWTFAQEQDAEKVFQQLEAKIEKAKSVHCSFKGEMGPGGRQGPTVQGSYQVGPGDKFQLTTQGKEDKEGRGKLTLVFENDQMTGTAGGPDGQSKKEMPVPAGAPKALRTAMLRGGPTAWNLWLGPQSGNFLGVKPGSPDWPAFTASKFRLGDKAKVGERDALVLEYTLDFDKKPYAVKLWLDAETKLPLKREIIIAKEGVQGRIVETYSGFKLDEQGVEKGKKGEEKDREKAPKKDSEKEP
jgi:outer membrane lipoprotein-sorting protein